MREYDYVPLMGHFDPVRKRRFKGGGGGGSSTQTVQNFSPEEAARRGRVQDEAQRIYNATAGSISSSPYPGSQVVPFSPETLAGQQFLKNFAYQAAPAFNQALGQATKFGLGDVLYADSNPYLGSAINAAIRPVTESYTDPGGVFSQIRTSAIGNGGYGRSSRQGIAEGIAAGRYADAIGDISSKMASEGYQSGLDTFAKTYALAPQTQQAMMTPGNILTSLGLQRENLQQMQEDYAANSRNWDLNAAWMPLQNWANIVYGGSLPTSTTSTTSGNMRSNSGMNMLGGALSGYSLGTAMGFGGPIGAIGGAILGGMFG